ncbi:MAG: TadE/TadG family type IV pilus assembly protein [Allosphingosinicella sp.]
MMLKRLLRRDNKGIGAVEFALVAPVLISFVIGISQMGKLFFANADMKNAMAHGARAASVWPVPEAQAIEDVVNDRLARSSGLSKANVEIERDFDDKGNEYIDIDMTYQVPLEFIFFDVGPIALKDSRRVFIQMDGVEPEDDEDDGTADPSTSATSAGGTTSSTSATSAGGTTSTTSSTTSASTTSSSGNSNGNSSHGHGNCKKKC